MRTQSVLLYDYQVSSNPPAVPADTSPEVWRIQMDAIARRTPAERLVEWDALNTAIAQMEADGVRRRHPHYSDRDVFLAIVRHRHGDELFQAAWPGEPLLQP